MANKKNELLTQTELSLMNLLWELGESTVRQVRGSMSNAEEIPYTTVAAVIRLLDKKGFLESRLVGNTLHYSPAVEKQEYEAKAINQIVEKLFNGAPVALATRLIDDQNLSKEELQLVRDELDRKLGEAQYEDDAK
ncbi:MAG: transcriptional regulator [SAR86 cluster bacterium]|uniref:Transcriptional regulator n=1 Tax=SAR86 cluster bacterium TaxID=2030880 RepID=A0A2A4X299_9GAMM|nr:MAG: transcriptional regulator [SAR86 cluster bacterium]